MPTVNLTERLNDLTGQAEDRGFVTHTTFLTPAEKSEAEIWLKKTKVPHFFSGGIPDAERQICFFLPEYLKDAGENADGILSDTLTALRLETPARSETPNHRDYLGSLLSLGIRRELLGDILIGEHTAFVPVMANIADFITSSLERIGGQPVKVTAVPLSDMSAKAREFETVRMTVASLRLDKIAAGGFGVSRTEMADMIRSGLVRVNWREEKRPDTDVAIGAVISLSGYGRIRLVSEEGLSRKERHILLIERFK